MKEYQSLKGRKVFREVLRRGRRFNGEEIQVIVYQLTGSERSFYKNNNTPFLNIARVGIQVQKKYGNAVIRNRAKRRVRVICSELLKGVESNFYIIIRPMENFRNLNYSDSKIRIELSLKKAGVLRPR